MFEPWLCTGGKHLAPETGGSCPCGMVTRIPAPKRLPAEPPPEVRAMLAQYLDEWSESLEAAASRVLHELEAAASRLLAELEAAASRLLHEQADRLMPALAATRLVLGAGDADRRAVPWIDVAQPAALAYTAPRAASHTADRADTLSRAANGDAPAPPRLFREGGGYDRADGQAGRRTRKKTGQKHRQQPGRAKRLPSADGLIPPPASRPGDRPMGPPGIFGEHCQKALCEAV